MGGWIGDTEANDHLIEKWGFRKLPAGGAEVIACMKYKFIDARGHLLRPCAAVGASREGLHKPAGTVAPLVKIDHHPGGRSSAGSVEPVSYTHLTLPTKA